MLASRNSTCLAAAGDLGSGRTAITGPMVPMAFWTSWRPAMGMAQCGSILAMTWRTSWPSACALLMASFSYSVHCEDDLAAALITGDLAGADFAGALAPDLASVLLAAFLPALTITFFATWALDFFGAAVSSSIFLLSALVAGSFEFLRYAAIISEKMSAVAKAISATAACECAPSSVSASSNWCASSL